MKKVCLTLAFVIMIFSTNVCLAGENGNTLSKAEKTIGILIDSLDKSENSATYNELSKGFNQKLKETVTADGLKLLQDQVAERFGRPTETKMVSFERFDQSDRIVYLGSFSKENIVRLVFVFDKDGKMADFAFTPVTVMEEK